MNLELMTFCDAATDAAGKLNILGAADTILVTTLPCKIDRCSIAMRFRMGETEQGQHQVQVAIKDSNDAALMNMNGMMNIQLRAGMTTATANLIININGLEIKQLGEYRLDVSVDGTNVGASPLFVWQLHRQNPGPSVN